MTSDAAGPHEVDGESEEDGGSTVTVSGHT